jgi:mono/diheme cytochrome c family protein
MRRGLVTVVGMVAVLAMEAGGPAAVVSSANAGAAAPAMAQATGKAVFEGKGNCATCHGKDARGTPLGPDLTDGQWLSISGSLEEIAALVRAGVARPKKYPAPMPPMGGARLRDAELEAVARYVLELNPAASPPK